MNGKDLYPDNNSFWQLVSDYYPEDLEFFIWHPEIMNGKYYNSSLIHRTILRLKNFL